MSNPKPYVYHPDGDATLVKQIQHAKWIQYALLLVDLLAALFADGDMDELVEMKLPFWWWFLAVAMHILFTICLASYFTTTTRYLCKHKPSAAIMAMNKEERQRDYEYRIGLSTFFGVLSVALLAIVDILPHILTAGKSFIMFEVGLIMFKSTMMIAALQAMFFLVGHSWIKSGLAEWRELRAEYDGFTFKDYAEYYDGYEDSIVIR